jgi:hypothetical protein
MTLRVRTLSPAVVLVLAFTLEAAAEPDLVLSNVPALQSASSPAPTVRQLQAMSQPERRKILDVWINNALTFFVSETDRQGRPKSPEGLAADRAMANLIRALFLPESPSDKPFGWQEVEDRMANPGGGPDQPALQVVGAYVDERYRQWVDAKIVALPDRLQLLNLKYLAAAREHEAAMLNWWEKHALAANPQVAEYFALSDSEKLARARHSIDVATELEKLLSRVLPHIATRFAGLKGAIVAERDGYRSWESSAVGTEAKWIRRALVVEVPPSADRRGSVLHYAQYVAPGIPERLARLQFTYLKQAIHRVLKERWTGSDAVGTWSESCGPRSTDRIEIGIYPFASVRLKEVVPASTGQIANLIVEINCPSR